MNLTSFYGGPNGQSFYIKKVFTNKNGLRQESLVNDLARGWTSPVSVGEFVMVSYGLPGDNKYEDYKKVDLDAEGKAYNATLWQKTYDETAGNANGLAYKMIASLAGNTPKIHVGDTIVLDPVENPDVDIDITDPDQPELTFSLPRAVKFWYGDRLGKRNDITYIDTSEEYKDCGIGDYYINKETGFIYLITAKNGNTCTFVFQACFQAPTPDVDTIVISPYKADGTINEPFVEKRYTNDEKTQWELIFNLPKAPIAKGEAEAVGSLEPAVVDTSILNADTLLFDFKIPRGSRIIPAERIEDLDMTQVKPGDYFLNALTGQLHLLNLSEEWVLQPGSLKGPPGDALHIVKSFELEVTKDFENNLINGRDYIINYYNTNDPEHEFKSDQLYEITWVETIELENGITQDLYSYYWYYVADDGNWGRVELAGGGGANSIENEFDPEIAGPVTDKTYSVHYINELIKDEPILDPIGGEGTKLRRTTLSTNLLIKLLSWGDYEDALGDLDPVIDPDAISKLEILSGPSKIVYEYGDTFDPSGMVIKAVKEDNSVVDVDITEYTFKPMVLDKIGTQTITATYKEASITFDVTVNDKVVAIPTWKEDLYFTNNFQSVDDVDVWNNYNKSYMTISGESSGKNVGSYEATFTLKDGYVWNDGSKEIKTVQWGIQKAVINSTPQQDGVLTYDGSIQTPNWLNYNENQLTISGDTSGTEVGKYNATFTVKDGYRWFDTDDLSKDVQWEITNDIITFTVEVPNGGGKVTLQNLSTGEIQENSIQIPSHSKVAIQLIPDDGYIIKSIRDYQDNVLAFYYNDFNSPIQAVVGRNNENYIAEFQKDIGQLLSNDWQLSNEKNSHGYNCAIFEDNKFIIGTSFSVIKYSDDAVNWNKANISSTTARVRIGKMAYGDGVLVTIPNSHINSTSSEILYSEDGGINWKEIEYSIDDPDAISYSNLLYGNGKFIILGNKKVMYSIDGQSWNEAVIPFNNCHSIATYHNGKFFAQDWNDYKFYSSIDGINWEDINSNVSIRMSTMASGNGKLISLNYYGKEKQLAISEDGINWQYDTLPVSFGIQGAGFEELCYIGNIFIATLKGDNSINKIIFSKDGINWGILEIPFEFNITNNTYAKWSVAYGKDKIMLVSCNDNDKIIYTELI